MCTPSTKLQSTCWLLGEGFLAIQHWGEGGSVISSDCYFVCELCHHYYYYRMRQLSRERYALLLPHYNPLAGFWGRGSWLFRIGGRGGSVISSDCYFVCELCHHYYYYRMRQLKQGEICTPSSTLQSTCWLLGEGVLAIQHWGEGGNVISSDCYFVCELCHHYYYYRMRQLSRERYALLLPHYNPLAD